MLANVTLFQTNVQFLRKRCFISMNNRTQGLVQLASGLAQMKVFSIFNCVKPLQISLLKFYLHANFRATSSFDASHKNSDEGFIRAWQVIILSIFIWWQMLQEAITRKQLSKNDKTLVEEASVTNILTPKPRQESDFSSYLQEDILRGGQQQCHCPGITVHEDKFILASSKHQEVKLVNTLQH